MDGNVYSTRIVAFIDILGFAKSHIEKTKKDKLYAKYLLDILKKIKQEKSEAEWLIEGGRDNNREKEVTVFSDSIVISYSLDYGNIYWILSDLIYFQKKMISEGIVVRGGVSIGELYHQDDIVFGPAMIDAYCLESKEAIYPRIIFTKETFNKSIKESLEENSELGEESMYSLELIKKDEESDSIYYLDFLLKDDGGYDYQAKLKYEKDYSIFIENVRRVIENGSKEKEPRTIEKYTWLKKYFNNVAKKNGFEIIL